MQAGGDEDENVIRATPCSSRVRSIGGRIRRFGTGRVMSQMRMQAFLRPRATRPGGGRRWDGGGRRRRLRRGRPAAAAGADGQRADEPVVGKVHVESGSTVVETYAHGGSGSGEWFGVKDGDGYCRGAGARFQPLSSRAPATGRVANTVAARLRPGPIAVFDVTHDAIERLPADEADGAAAETAARHGRADNAVAFRRQLDQ